MTSFCDVLCLFNSHTVPDRAAAKSLEQNYYDKGCGLQKPTHLLYDSWLLRTKTSVPNMHRQGIHYEATGGETLGRLRSKVVLLLSTTGD